MLRSHQEEGRKGSHGPFATGLIGLLNMVAQLEVVEGGMAGKEQETVSVDDSQNVCS